ncbi:hypothetical protein C1H46_028992 [Malus baccata]|uniref:Uncharacterized protein n=1 Tax=Malus baccata TaxID=106549 RepID=A0A540LGL2_MALBA|nr:hypothetical protein C1H46_028992 [Malus baccata]
MRHHSGVMRWETLAVKGKRVTAVQQVSITLLVVDATCRCGKGFKIDNGICLFHWKIRLELTESQSLPSKLTMAAVGHRHRLPGLYQNLEKNPRKLLRASRA